MATLEEISGKIDRVILAVVDLQEGQHRIEERMVTREQFDEALTNEDAMIVILKRLDEERMATIEWIRRLENDVVLLKRHLHLA